MDLVHGEDPWKNINPYHVIDGAWQSGAWVSNLDPDNPSNVFEEKFVCKTETDTHYISTYKWERVWDNKLQIWRDLTPEEHEKFDSKCKNIQWSKINSENAWNFISPLIKQTIGEAPLIRELFSNKNI